MKHILPTELLNKVLVFLASKPFSEVSSLIAEIQRNAVKFVDAAEQKPAVVATNTTEETK